MPGIEFATSRPKLLERISGTLLIAGGVWLAFSKR